MTAAVRPVTPAERGQLAQQGIRIGDHASAYLLAPDKGMGAVAVLGERAFESEMLAFPTRHLEEIRGTAHGEPSSAEIAGLLAALATAGVRLVTCRRPESDRAMLLALQAGGFRVIECLLTLARPLDGAVPAMPAGVSLAKPEDAEGCARVGGGAFRYDRFHADPTIDHGRADALKAAWAGNAVRGRADAVFVTRAGGAITGFSACLLRGDIAVIDLIGVAPAHQAQGLGRALTEAALAHYAGRAKRMLVGTQSCNYASLALYQRAGFRIESSALTLHAHLGLSET